VYNSSDANSTVVRHREFIQNVTSSATAGAFKIETFAVNPAQSNTFPWLASIAQNFEEWVPEGIVFEFQSTSSDAIASSTNLALGSLMMCSQYDPTNEEFVNSQQLLNYDWAQSCKVSETSLHFLECDPAQNPIGRFYTRTGAELAEGLRFTDLANFSIATEGLQGTNVQIGRLWVSYQIRLGKPKLGSVAPAAGGWFKYNCDTGISATQPAGTIASATYDAENNLPLVIADSVNDATISFPASANDRSFMITLAWTGASTANITKPSVTCDANSHIIQHWDDDQTASTAWPSASSTSSTSGITFILSLPGDGLTTHLVTFTQGTVFSSLNVVDIAVSQIPYLSPEIYGG